MGQSLRSNAPAFVMPHFGDQPFSHQHLRSAIESVMGQSDSDWNLLIVDDCSPETADRAVLERAAASDGIHVHTSRVRLGPGECRNQAIRMAQDLAAAFVLFLDSDDVATEDRLARTRETFSANPDASVIYSRFDAIDGAGQAIPESSLTPSIRAILQALAHTPPSGPSAWIDMATTSGYSNLTSTTAVRTGVAVAVPFPDEYVSDDLHTWLRYGGFGASYVCIPQVLCHYRIPDAKTGSSSRRRYGTGFYRAKARVDSEGLELAFNLAIAGARLHPHEVPAIRHAFRERLAREIAEEGELALAEELLRLPPEEIAPTSLFLAASVARGAV